MSIPHLKSGEIVHLPIIEMLPSTKTATLVKTDGLEVIRLVILAGQEISTHKAPGPITVQCLDGRVRFTAHDRTHELDAGKFLYLSSAQPHSLAGIEDSSLLLTIWLPRKEPHQPLDMVQEAGEESFPASDSPAITKSKTRP